MKPIKPKLTNKILKICLKLKNSGLSFEKIAKLYDVDRSSIIYWFKKLEFKYERCKEYQKSKKPLKKKTKKKIKKQYHQKYYSSTKLKPTKTYQDYIDDQNKPDAIDKAKSLSTKKLT